MPVPGAPSHGRVRTSTASPGAANGRFVAPRVASKLLLVPGIKLQPACASRIATAPTTVTTASSARTSHFISPRIFVVAGPQSPSAPPHERLDGLTNRLVYYAIGDFP